MDRVPDSVCETCEKTWSWHLNNHTQHPFNDGSVGTSQTFGKRLPDGSRTPPGGVDPTALSERVVAERWPFDPVLRQALIDKGVLTPEELIQAEQKIRAVTDAFHVTGAKLA